MCSGTVEEKLTLPLCTELGSAASPSLRTTSERGFDAESLLNEVVSAEHTGHSCLGEVGILGNERKGRLL